MELRFFKCSKCNEMYVGRTDDRPIQCGALVAWAFSNGKETPLGCGGRMIEITREEAESSAYESI